MAKKTDTNNHSIVLYITNSKTEDMQNKKNEIVKTCQDLWNNKKIDITVVDYDDPEREGDVPQNFIKKNADFVIFLIDDSYDEKALKLLKDRIKIASDSYLRNFKPFIMVYLTKALKDKIDKKEADSKDSKYGLELYKLLFENKSKKIKVAYEDESGNIKVVDDEKKSIAEVIKEDILLYERLSKEDIDENPVANNWVKDAQKLLTENRIKSVFIIVLTSVFFSVIGGTCSYISNQKRLVAEREQMIESQPRLLLAGGGSAKNLIKQEFGIDIISYNPKFWIYANMPSQNSWTMLREEAMKEDKDRKYYPICLSAEEADTNKFLGSMKVQKFKETGVVVSVLVGYDTLVAYCNASYINSFYLNKMLKQGCPKLSCDKFDSIIISNFDSILRKEEMSCLELNAIVSHDTNILLYATSMKSGTRDAYIDSTKANIKLLKEEKTPSGESIRLFTDAGPIDSTENFIVLGSTFYKPSGGLSKAKPLIVTDSNGNPIKKPIYLYFMAYKSGEEYVIKEEIGTFLDEIEKNRISKKEKPQLKDHISKKLESIKTNDTIFIVKDTI